MKLFGLEITRNSDTTPSTSTCWVGQNRNELKQRADWIDTNVNRVERDGVVTYKEVESDIVITKLGKMILNGKVVYVEKIDQVLALVYFSKKSKSGEVVKSNKFAWIYLNGELS